MATPIPERNWEFFEELHPDKLWAAKAEWLVYRKLRRQLDRRWRLLAHTVVRKPGKGNHEREADIILLHPDYGIALGEVKSNNTHVDTAKEAGKQIEGVRDFLKQVLLEGGVPGAEEFSRLRFFLACPDVKHAPRKEELSIYFNGHEVIVHDDLENLSSVIEEQVCQGVDKREIRLGEANVDKIVAYLTRHVTLEHNEGAFTEAVGHAAEQEIHEQVRALIGMDRNSRAFVSGGAGSGKTWLATEWARKAAGDDNGGEGDRRVLLTCYNEALAEGLAESMSSVTHVTVQAFLRHLEDQLGEPHVVAERGEDLKERWLTLSARIEGGATPQLGRFDVIVVDEIQDFDEEWIGDAMPMLLKEGGRILAVGDRRQNVRGVDLSYLDEGWALNELQANLRSPAEIARFAERFGGAPAEGPEWPPRAVEIRPVRSEGELVDVISSLVSGLQPARRDKTWVLTTSEATRDLLRSVDGQPPFVRWNERESGVLCVTAEKVKGLEAAHVILVADRLPERGREIGLDELFYAGATRAVEKLTVLTTPEAAAALAQEGPIDWPSVLPAAEDR